ncbi:MAG: 3-phosphoserine/phosphohydroxythreonine transaminase [Candidatus Nealsonbacteria bacterium]|nr:3-phosphoserine/phosphohydroxythreonine transaminase [Candidatus Nealsonbacteria bacterium]
MEERVYNFSPGPAMLPLAALEEARRDLLAMPGVGISILEISHRSPTFTGIIEAAEANLRKLLAVPDNYRVLFLQGGALLQFATIPMNLATGGAKPAYILSGTWGNKAMQEVKAAEPTVVWDGKSTNNNRVPTQDELDVPADAAYVHITSNETIQGVQFPVEPDVGNVPLVCDSSSDILSRPVDVKKYGLLYACAQKNAGPAGVTIVIVRDDLLERTPAELPSMLNYKVLAAKKSMLNTPPVFAIYMVKLVTDWLLREIGSLEEMARINRQKAQLLYDVVDGSDGFYEGHAEPDSRSMMNVPFRLADATLDGPFLEQAAEQGLASLKGHRSVGGCRASIYNAMPVEGVKVLRDFMLDFCKNNK